MLKFGIKLTDIQGELITPPPAYLLLPYYFDQDTSWAEKWRSFTRLQQIKNWRRDLIEYHVGLKPNEYYTAKGAHLKAKADFGRADAARLILKGVRDQVADEYQEVHFTVDLEAFQEEIKELLVNCARVQKEADKIKAELVERLHRQDGAREPDSGHLRRVEGDQQGFPFPRDPDGSYRLPHLRRGLPGIIQRGLRDREGRGALRTSCCTLCGKSSTSWSRKSTG